MLDFYISHNERTIHLKVPDNEDVKTLKSLIQGETGFSPCQQTLRGFQRGFAAHDLRPHSDHRQVLWGRSLVVCGSLIRCRKA